MKEHIGTAMNALYASTEDGGVRAMAEIILLYSEPAYQAGVGGIERTRKIGDVRISMTVKGMRETAETLLKWADAAETDEDRINEALCPTAEP
ncbi:hypothetical protein TSA6c_00380 [Azospirillum sp. TSA6c]|uniref:hypothetical protein n=1 Tax=Azospirillum sp. TSA6c TaxID=709813 RepID=UPI000D618E92|nr:hypothetical protein [Azospirillum sp. TSA6c]PWC54359.1 hypothetical protein TSA6c_00380 [Azospirillum sp. TSA6c]